MLTAGKEVDNQKSEWTGARQPGTRSKLVSGKDRCKVRDLLSTRGKKKKVL